MKTNSSVKRKPFSRIFVLAFALIVSIHSFAQPSQDSLTCMQISGKVKKLKGTVRSYTVELVHDTNVVSTSVVEGRHGFKFFLQKNTYYGIRISCDGYVSRVISINTELPLQKRFDKFYRFHFDTELIEEINTPALDRDALDFPIALVYFDKKRKCFYYNENYTSFIKNRIYTPETARR
jgi:hypothetical protein